MPRLFADAAGGVNVGMRAYTAIFPGGAGIHFDHAYYRDEHLAAMQRMYGDALTRVEMRKPLVAEGEPPSPYAAIVNFWIPDPEVFAKASAAHGQTLVQDKAHFTNSEQKVQSEVVFGEAGKPASAVRTGDRCLTVLYPHDPADRFDYEYYRDHHMTSLIKLFGHEAISRMEIRKSLSSAGWQKSAPLRLHCEHLCRRRAGIRRRGRQESPARRRRHPAFHIGRPISVMTEVLGAFDA